MGGSIRSLWSRLSSSSSPSKPEQSSGSSQFSQQVKKSIEECGQRMRTKMGHARRGIKKAASKARNMRTHFYSRGKTIRKRMERYTKRDEGKSK